MNWSEITTQTRRWHGLMLGALVVAMMHLSGATNAARDNEPWPELLSSASVRFDPEVALLQRRAAETLERLTQSSPPTEPL